MTCAASLALIACISVAPPGVCRAEYQLAVHEEPLPAWATESWVKYAAHVVASESRNVPVADCVVARNIVLDVETGRLAPWRLNRRWYGYGTPDDKDREAVRLALRDRCGDVPHYRFVGNLKDLRVWRARGYVGEQQVDLYLGQNGSSVVGVP